MYEVLTFGRVFTVTIYRYQNARAQSKLDFIYQVKDARGQLANIEVTLRIRIGLMSWSSLEQTK